MTTGTPPVIVWFQADLRLGDNPALYDAAETGQPILPVFVHENDPADRWAPGGASRWWLHHSLEALAANLRHRGLPLVLRRGDCRRVIPAIATEVGATTVVWNRRAEGHLRPRDTEILRALQAAGVEARVHDGNSLYPLGAVRPGSGECYRVFSPFWRACMREPEPSRPLPVPGHMVTPVAVPPGEALSDWAFLPRRPDWSGGLEATWVPGETGAHEQLRNFLEERLAEYRFMRDRPDLDQTSRLSPHLSWGEISPRQIWHAVRHSQVEAASSQFNGHGEAFLRQLGWREFCRNMAYSYADLPTVPLNRRFDVFPWIDNAVALRAWQQGRTGYPIVDAGMRQLWEVGWMHNRVRMIVGSFLVKHLLLPWQQGEAWFWDTLVDADLANNAVGWQWVTGCGTDAAPYVRVFNPILQGTKFDPDGSYVRRYVPELAKVPSEFIHEPWRMPPLDLAGAGVCLGKSYPHPIIGHEEGRRRALSAFNTSKNEARTGTYS